MKPLFAPLREAAVRVTYVGPDIDGVEVADLNIIANHGEPIDVPDELAARLLEQPVWTAAPRDVLAVAADPAHAGRLLEAEQRRPSPRGELLDQLRELAEPAVAADDAGDEVPDARADVVLAWVGTDLARAHRALAAEQARDKPRDNVVTPLGHLLATSEGTD